MSFKPAAPVKKRKRILVRRKRTIDPNIKIDYKNPEGLRRFITDRGKIIPRRISGATAQQQREICLAIKRARYLALLPYTVSHRSEKGFYGDMSSAGSYSPSSSRRPYQQYSQPQKSRDEDFDGSVEDMERED